MMEESGSSGYWLYLGLTGVPGLAQLGWLRRIEERGVRVAGAIGTGLGALAAALWATESDLTRVGRVLAHLSWEPSDGLEWLDVLTKGHTFESLRRPLIVTALDYRTGQRSHIRSGSVASAVRRALGLPGWIPPVACADSIWGDAGPLSWTDLQAATGLASPRMATIRIEQAVYDGDVGALELAVLRALHEYRRGAFAGAPSARCSVGPLEFARLPEACDTIYRELAAYPTV